VILVKNRLKRGTSGEKIGTMGKMNLCDKKLKKLKRGEAVFRKK